MTHTQLLQYFSGFVEFDADFEAELRFYTNQSRLHATVLTNQHIPNIYLSDTAYGTHYGAHLLNTELQYQASLNYQVMLYRQQYPKLRLSFVEVFMRDEFLCRHFIRHYELTPFVSIEPREFCPYLKRRLIGNEPVLDMKRMISDKLWGRLSKNINYYKLA